MDVTKLQGQKVGEYEIIKRIGMPTMSVVYLAKGCDGLRAIKFPIERMPQSSAVLEDIMVEGNIGKCLNHPNIVRIEGMDTWEGFPFLVMEFVRWNTLKQLTESLKAKGTVWNPETVVLVGKQLLAAIEYLHEHSIPDMCVVHCNIKPDNIMLGPNVSVKLIGLGNARYVCPDGYEGYWAMPRNVDCPDKEAPIICPNDFFPRRQSERRHPSPRTDIYMVASCMTYMLLGDMPFDDIPPGLLVPGEFGFLEEIIRKARAYNPEARYQSAIAMLEALEYASRHLSINAGLVKYTKPWLVKST